MHLRLSNRSMNMSSTDRPLIAVIRGGYSGESVISHQSAARMMAAIDRAVYEPLFVTIEQEGWSCSSSDGDQMVLDRGQFAVETISGLRRFDAALIAVHGAPGENGLLQGYLDLLGIPYQTGGVLNMATTFSKYSTTALLREMGFRVAPSQLLFANTPDPVERIAQLGYPCFVKPDQSGSSLGVTKVKTPSELNTALSAAFRECHMVMVEAAVSGAELTCGVLGTKDVVQALPVCEIRTSREFFDFEAKYLAQDTQELIPAPLPDEVTRLVQKRSVDIFRSMDCRGMVRVDHFWTGTDLVTIEINTVPGFSGASIYPKMLEVCGLGIAATLNGIISSMLTSDHS